jgi:hypothetical protein
MTVALGCGHGLQIRDGQDTREENLPESGPWVFYPVMDEHPLEVGDGMSCVVCMTFQTVTGISPELIPIGDSGELKL